MRTGSESRSCLVWGSGPPWVRHDGGGTQGCYRGASLGWRASFLQAASAHRHCGKQRSHVIESSVCHIETDGWLLLK